MMSRHRSAVLLVALVALLLVPDVAACPSCKETVGEQSGMTLGAGLSFTVYGMIAMVFGVVATVASVIVRAYRRAAPR